MENIGLALFMLSFVLFFAAYILYLIAGFTASVAWGMVHIFLSPLTWIPFTIIYWKSDNKYNKWAFSAVIIGVVCFLIGITIGMKYAKPDEVLGNSNIGYSIIKTSGWKPDDTQFKNADIQLKYIGKELYFVTFSEENDDEIKSFVKDTADKIKTQLNQSRLGDCIDIILKEQRTCEIEISGCNDSSCHTYLLTSIEKNDKKIMLLGWSLMPEIDKNRSEILEIRNSISWFDEKDKN